MLKQHRLIIASFFYFAIASHFNEIDCKGGGLCSMLGLGFTKSKSQWVSEKERKVLSFTNSI